MNLNNLGWLRKRLLRWFNLNGRTYPWRQTRDPYKILLAEMLLRRTWADQVVPVYECLIQEYPDSQALTTTTLTRLRRILWPLGLHSRSEELFETARDIKELFDCRVPATRTELKQLRGVGDYVAGAVLSLAFNKQEWIVDTNVVRVFSRFFGLELPGELRRHPTIIQLARQYVKSTKPGRANLAILDHGAMVCMPRKPDCCQCILRSRCLFYQSSTREPH